MIELIPIDDDPFEKYKGIEPISGMLRDIKARRDSLNARWDMLPIEKRKQAYNDIMERVDAVSKLIMQRELAEPLKFIIGKSKLSPTEIERLQKGEIPNA